MPTAAPTTYSSKSESVPGPMNPALGPVRSVVPSLLSSVILFPEVEQVEQALSTFDYFGGEELLNGAIVDCTRALQSPSILSDTTQAVQWRLLRATARYLLFERDGQDADLEDAKSFLEALLTTPHLSTHISALYGLGRVYEAHHDHYAASESKNIALEYYQKALTTARDHEHALTHLQDEISVHLGRQLVNFAVDSKASLSEAIGLMSSVIQRARDNQPIKGYSLGYLGLAYYRRWALSGESSDLSRAEELLRQALLLCPLHRHRYRFLRGLAYISISGGTVESTLEGISLTEQAMALLRTIPPVNAAERAVFITLAWGYASIFELEGRLSDLDQAIRLLRSLSSSWENVENNVLDALCKYLSMRFEATGHLVDIDGAIEVSLRSLAMQPSGRAADYARVHLGEAYVLRFGVNGEREDFDAAQVHLETGLRESSTAYLRPFFLRLLATLYRLHFEMSNELVDIDSAVENIQEAVALMQNRQPLPSELPSYLSDHGAYLLKRFEVQRNSQDLADATAIHEKALEASPDAYHERHFLIWRYGCALRLRFQVFGYPQDSEKCLELLEEALHGATAARVPKQCLYLGELASLHASRYARYSRPEDLELSLDYYMKAAETFDGLTSDRFGAAVTGARLARKHSRMAQSSRLFSAAVSLLPRIAWLGLNQSKRHAKLVQTAAQLACDAAAVAIGAHELERAVELLDEGRSVMWRSVLELRTDLKMLEDIAPDLAGQLLIVAQFLEHDEMGGSEVSHNHAEQRASRRRRTAERWEELVQDVRALQGFKSFLRPLEFSVLRTAAQQGPIVLLNVSDYRSDALIVTKNEPVRSIALPGLEYDTIRQLSRVLAHTLHVARDYEGCQTLENVLVEICRQLWNGGMDTVAALLLDLQEQPDGRPLHVWWIPTGFLSLLPVHCAGPYRVDDLGISDLFISSYSTTLSALLRSRQSRASHDNLQSQEIRLLAIGLPETPGMPPLSSTGLELAQLAVNPALGKSCSFLYGLEATIGAVTNALPYYNWLHASCHGHFNQRQPLESAFNLIDGPLTLSRIAQLHLKDADFAFLSACHTARQTASVPDESLHLAAGLQIAGFRGVVGTAWSMADRDAPLLAEKFYKWLTQDGRAPDARNAADALHLALKDLREIGIPLYRCAAFVHFGI